MAQTRLIPAYIVPAAQRPSRAPLVPAIRSAVRGWRDQGYPAATETSRHLLRHWFESEHETSVGDSWSYYYCQREAIETLIYLYEVLGKRRLYSLAQEFDTEGKISAKPARDRWPRYVFKMATGSGKTKVMSLAVVWHYFNALHESGRRGDYAQSFVLIAPNVIVYQRLLEDFRDGAIFRGDPLIPPEWKPQWRFSVITRDDPAVSPTPGTLYLTNIHQLYASRGGKRGKSEPPALTAVLGGPAPSGDQITNPELLKRMLSHDKLLVLNDEGHHIHTDDLEWAKVIGRIHAQLGERFLGQLDFTATPKHTNGRLFDEIIVDYPIAQAIDDQIVKRPELGTLKGESEYPSSNAADAHRDKLNAGIQKWKQIRDQLAKVEHNPLLFVMAENTKAADEIGEWLKTQPEFDEDSVLVIHTNHKGDIVEGASARKQKELDKLRKAAREVDAPNSRYRAIVSVLMLREGWDVKNVCVIVPLRAYSAKAQILPEQTLGRGLRRMMPVLGRADDEKLIVVEHEAFSAFWKKELEEEEGFEIDQQPIEQAAFKRETILVDPGKLEFDIDIPRVSPALVRMVPDLTRIDPSELPQKRIPLPSDAEIADNKLTYVGIDMLERYEIGREEFEKSTPADPARWLNHAAELILKRCGLRNLAQTKSQLMPLMRRYIEDTLFGGEAWMDDRRVMSALNSGDAQALIFTIFADAVGALSIAEREISAAAQDPIHVSKTPAFTTTRRTEPVEKSVFNRACCDSLLEVDFARWLDLANDVSAFAKNEDQIRFSVPYQDANRNLRYYRPDFVVRTKGGMWVIEAKGLETVEVPRKDKRMAQWCRAVSDQTAVSWRYLKVPQQLFEDRQWLSLAQLAAAVNERG